MTQPLDTTDLLPAVLAAAVRRITAGAADTPRAAQADLAQRIGAAMNAATSVTGDGSMQVLAQASTGIGKSLAYLAPALLAAAVRGERTVISTESLSLQSQLVDRDGPLVAAAVEDVTGVRPTIAVHKGWANYVCGMTAASTLGELAGVEIDSPQQLEGAGHALGDLARFAHGRKGLISAGTISAALSGRGASARQNPRAKDPAYVAINGQKVPAEPMFRLLQQASSTQNPATHDKHHLDVDESLWQYASIAAAGCPGTANCPFGAQCAPASARAVSSAADVLVTNHKLLAIQATRRVPVVIGSRKLGMIDHLVVDEAHELPRIVRDTGADEVSGHSIRRLVRRISRVLVDDGGTVNDGEAVADSVDHAIGEFVAGRSIRGSAPVALGENDAPLSDVAQMIADWAKAARSALPDPASLNRHAESVRVRNLASDLTAVIASVATANQAQIGVARWVEVDRLAVRTSPIDVAMMLRGMLYRAQPVSGGDPANPDDEVAGIADHRLGLDGLYPLSVTMVSATLPDGFSRAAGLSVPALDYPSPFTEAFASSALYVPGVTAEDVAVLTGGTGRFTTSMHAAWAAPKITELVAANDGSALVLATTRAAGEAYAARLRADLSSRGLDHITVLSQWDGPAVRTLLDRWRDDHHSVMVGTRSLMTGVDAPGQTCSLVVIDRIPRSAGNPVDDARVAAMVAATGMNRWAADDLVYVADAKLLLQQAVGRLIRRHSDSGMVAVLDPRLLGGNPLSQKTKVRTTYLGALTHLGHKLRYLDEATDWLTGHRRMQEAA